MRVWRHGSLYIRHVKPLQVTIPNWHNRGRDSRERHEDMRNPVWNVIRRGESNALAGQDLYGLFKRVKQLEREVKRLRAEAGEDD